MCIGNKYIYICIYILCFVWFFSTTSLNYGYIYRIFYINLFFLFLYCFFWHYFPPSFSEIFVLACWSYFSQLQRSIDQLVQVVLEPFTENFLGSSLFVTSLFDFSMQDQVWNAISPQVRYMTSESISEFVSSPVSMKHSYVTSFSIGGNAFVKNK